MNSLANPKVTGTLRRLHSKARAQQRFTFGNAARIFMRHLTGESVRSKKSNAKAYMAVEPDAGKLLYFLATYNNSKNIVEFGTSFGISTIYLAAAAKDNGGAVITTELVAAKAGAAKVNITQAGLDDFVTILPGDAMKTLSGIKNDIDFLFLDGAKQLYLPIYKMLRPRLTKGAVVYADNIDKRDTHDFLHAIQADPDFKSVHLFGDRALVSYKNDPYKEDGLFLTARALNRVHGSL